MIAINNINSCDFEVVVHFRLRKDLYTNARHVSDR